MIGVASLTFTGPPSDSFPPSYPVTLLDTSGNEHQGALCNQALLNLCRKSEDLIIAESSPFAEEFIVPQAVSLWLAASGKEQKKQIERYQIANCLIGFRSSLSKRFKGLNSSPISKKVPEPPSPFWALGVITTIGLIGAWMHHNRSVNFKLHSTNLFA